MDLGESRSIGTSVAHYLLFATIGLLILNQVTPIETIVPFLLLSLLLAALFGILAIERLLTDSSIESEELSSAPLFPDPSPRSKLLLLAVLIVVGAVLRVYALGVQSFWFDEAITANAAIALLETGRPTFPSGYTYWRAFPHTLMVAASMALFDTHAEWAARLPSVLLGLATIPATYRLGKEVDGYRVGLLAAALLTFATWEIAWSRQARMYQLLQLLVIVALVLLLRIDAEDGLDYRSLAILGVVIGLAMTTHKIGYVLLPVALVFLGLTSYYDGEISRRNAAVFGALGVILVVFIEMVGSGFTGVLDIVLGTQVEYADAYLAWFENQFHAFFFLAVIGTAITMYRRRYRATLLLALVMAPALWILSYRTELFATRYLYFALPIMFVWASVTVVYASDILSEVGGPLLSRAEKRLESFQAGAVASVGVHIGIVLLLVLGGGFTVAPQAEYQLGPNAPQPDFKAAYEYVNENREPGDVIIAGWTAPGLYYAGGVDYWLAHDLTGAGGEYVLNSEERYSGATPIRTASKLQIILEQSNSGWIVVGNNAYLRQDSDTKKVLTENGTFEKNFEQITVFSWGQKK